METNERLRRLRAGESGDGLELSRARVGALRVTSGRVIACDPFYLLASAPLAVDVEPGEHEVSLTLLGRGSSVMVAAAVLWLSEREPTRWRAIRSTRQPEDEEAEGYDVDSARGCFVDADALGLGDDEDAGFDDAEPDPEPDRWAALLERLEGDLGAERGETISADVVWDPEDDRNLVAFETGAGDGSYVSWGGFDEEDRLVCLLTDFGLLDVPPEPEVEVASAARPARRPAPTAPRRPPPSADRDPYLEMEALGPSGVPKIVAHIVAGGAHGDLERAATAMRRMLGSKHLGAMVELVAHADERVRDAAYEALAQVGPWAEPAVAALLARVPVETPALRPTLLRCLTEIGPDAVATHLGALDDAVRAEVLAALAG